MGSVIAPAQNKNKSGFDFAHSDGEFEQNLRAAIEASNEEYAFRTQLEETLHLSTLTYAYDLQLADIAVPSPVPNPPSSEDGTSAPQSKDEASSSHSKDEKEYTPVSYYEHDNGYGGEKGESSRGKEVDRAQCSVQVKKAVPLGLCGICYENSASEMFEGIRCLDRFCHPCITNYIHTRLKQKRHQLYCPNNLCGEPLTLHECRYFLPSEIMDAWSAVILEAQIPEVQKVYCPFPDCSAMLLKEDVGGLSAMGILNAECPFCNRMFCVGCMAPWHADRDCE